MSRILLIIPNAGAGGAQEIFRRQLLLYSKHFETVGCVFNLDGSLPGDNGLGLISLDVPAGGNPISKAWRFVQRIRRLRRIKLKFNIDVSISHLEGADYVNVLSQTTDKTICWIHGTKKFDGDIRGPIGWLRRTIMMPVLYRKSNRIVAVSDGIRREMINITGRSSGITTILNGIDVDTINLKKLETPSFPMADLGPVIFTHCRLAAQKNIEGLINIFGKLRKKKKARLVIAGDGELKAKLIALTESKGLSSDIYFVGHQTNPYPLLAASTIYVMTSLWEGFPLALGESMACGVPSIAVDCFTGPREILAPELSGPQPIDRPYESEFGILMPLVDSQHHTDVWVDTLCSLLDDDAKRQRYSVASRHRIQAFDQKEVNKQWLQLING